MIVDARATSLDADQLSFVAKSTRLPEDFCQEHGRLDFVVDQTSWQSVIEGIVLIASGCWIAARCDGLSELVPRDQCLKAKKEG